MTKLIVLLFVPALVFTNARHIHPHGDPHASHQAVDELCEHGAKKALKTVPIKDEYINVEVIEEIPRNIKPNRFMPLNNQIFFMGQMPCPEEGFKRDYLGICREVWD
ncbi:uncharacterized protein LOC133521504 [Cydia pomonella]|uniref:uncharacterized protein LOC133521504 n=1 Tax=Cydia pomonella TaxID=82600 RepID=UPI002ADDD009|nr:uncharacterized protein LOC133521504 [Cydia pomonella]